LWKRLKLSSIGKGRLVTLEELIEAGTRPSEGDLAHAILRVVFKSGTQTPKRGIVNENWL
jgi:hypothetical protein